MADKNSYPQIPATVWWGVRAILLRTPSATIDETFLSVELSVQPTAARQYVSELRRVGLLDENSKATETAKKWRMEDTYREAVDEILAQSYPQALLDITPPGEADRDKVISWFQRQGLGEGSAKNKAATYLLIASAEPGEGVKPNPAKVTTGRKSSNGPSTPKSSTKSVKEDTLRSKEQNRSVAQMPLNLNLQIHIGADASIDQINAIFHAMRKYLSDDGTD